MSHLPVPLSDQYVGVGERRQIARNMEFVTHIHECDDDPDLVGKSIACEITDFSGHGLHVLTDVALVPDTLLNIKINVGSSCRPALNA